METGRCSLDGTGLPRRNHPKVVSGPNRDAPRREALLFEDPKDLGSYGSPGIRITVSAPCNFRQPAPPGRASPIRDHARAWTFCCSSGADRGVAGDRENRKPRPPSRSLPAVFCSKPVEHLHLPWASISPSANDPPRQGKLCVREPVHLKRERTTCGPTSGPAVVKRPATANMSAGPVTTGARVWPLQARDRRTAFAPVWRR